MKSPKPHQIDFHHFHNRTGAYTDGTRFPQKLLGSMAWHGMGRGKASRLTATVYTPSGPKIMRDIEVGEYVIGMDGMFKRVNSIHPQGVKPMFRVTFSDGATTDCCEEHLWSIRSPKGKSRGKGFIVKQLKDFRHDLREKNGNSKWEIPITSPVSFYPQGVDIPAYSLGVLIGDGSLTGSITITNASDHIYDRVRRELDGPDVSISRKWMERNNSYLIRISRVSAGKENWVLSGIRKYKLDVTAHFKHVPAEYKYNSIGIRLGVLRGLLDTDGFVDASGRVEYTSASKRLVEDVIEIVQSLGGTGSLNYKKTNIGTDAWTTCLKIPGELLHDVVSKPEKVAWLKPLTKYKASRYVASVEPVGEDECQCISVDGEHYLTDGFIVTHNTLSALWEARHLLNDLRRGGVMSPRFTVFCPNSAVHTWKKECFAECYDLKDLMTVYPYSQAHNATKSLKYFDNRMLILDESQALKSPTTNRVEAMAEYLHQLGTTGNQFKGGRATLLTGTPLPNHAAELYTSWAICGSPDVRVAAERLRDKKRIDEWTKTFAKKLEIGWTIGKGKPPSQQRKGHAVKYQGVDNVDMLQRLLTPFVHFRGGAGDVPRTHEIEVDLRLPDDVLLKNADIEKPEAYMAVVERLARAKTPHMLEWVKDFIKGYPGEQLIVFAMNRFPLVALKEAFPKDVELVIGPQDGMTNKMRDENLTGFQNKKVRILGMTYACGAESHNLQNCKVSLYLGFPWNDAKRRQAIARTARTGQQHETLHYFLMSGENDHKVLGDVKAKGETEKKVESLVAGNNHEESLAPVKNLLASFY